MRLPPVSAPRRAFSSPPSYGIAGGKSSTALPGPWGDLRELTILSMTVSSRQGGRLALIPILSPGELLCQRKQPLAACCARRRAIPQKRLPCAVFYGIRPLLPWSSPRSVAALPWKAEGFGTAPSQSLPLKQSCKPRLSRLAALLCTHSPKPAKKRSGLLIARSASFPGTARCARDLKGNFPSEVRISSRGSRSDPYRRKDPPMAGPR